MNIQKDWKAKLESAYSSMLKYTKITVCLKIAISKKFHTHCNLYFVYFVTQEDTKILTMHSPTRKLSLEKYVWLFILESTPMPDGTT